MRPLAPTQRETYLGEDPALFAALEVLLGEPAHLIKDKLIYKPAGVYGYPLHQGYIAWSDFPTSFTTAVVAIDASTKENGWIEVFPRAHAQGNLSPLTVTSISSRKSSSRALPLSRSTSTLVTSPFTAGTCRTAPRRTALRRSDGICSSATTRGATGASRARGIISRFVCVGTEVPRLLEAQGFASVFLQKLAVGPNFSHAGVQMREQMVSAWKPARAGADAEGDAQVAVVYRGPFREAVDDAGRRYVRGERVTVSADEAATLRRGPLGDQLVFLRVKPRLRVVLNREPPVE